MLNRIFSRIQCWYYLFNFCLAAARSKRRVFLMSTPWHGNLGDQAIILAEYQLLQKVFPRHTIVECPTEIIRLIRKYKLFRPAMQGDDIVVLHGGGNLGSLYPFEEEIHRWIVSEYSKQMIFFMSQSVFFSDDEEGQTELQKSQRVYSLAQNLTIFERDEISYSYAKKLFPSVNHILAPDTVTSLDCSGIFQEGLARRGVCFFLRNDKEKVLSDTLISELKSWLTRKKIPYTMSDTVINKTLHSNIDRQREVFKRLKMACDARLVITDRYHGTIFSVITHTPVIVFKSYDTKISSGIRWFKELPWVHYAENMDAKDIEGLIEHYCTGEEISITQYSQCNKKLLQKLKSWYKDVKSKND